MSAANLPSMLSEARAHLQAGRPGEAETLCRAVLKEDERRAEAWAFLGMVLRTTDRLEEAIACLRQAVRIKSSQAPFSNNLAVLLQEAGRFEASLEFCQKAVRLDPGCAGYRYTLGKALQRLDRLPEAERAYREAIQRSPTYFEAHLNLGNVLLRRRHLAEAESCLRRACDLRPADPLGPVNLGAVLQAQGRLGEARAQYERAQALAPDLAPAWTNLGTVLQDQGDLSGAMTQYDRALALDPLNGQAHWNRAFCLLLRGDYEPAFRAFEWREALPGVPRRVWSEPRWDGGPLGGRTILLTCEQGQGDSLQFIRFARRVKRLGGRVLVECQPSLAGLLARVDGVDEVVPHGQPLPPFEVQCPLLSLPGVLGLSLPDVGLACPLVEVPALEVERWALRMGDRKAFRVGIAWQGNPDYELDAFRSIPLAPFASLARLEGVQVFSLQKGPGREQLEAAGGGTGIVDLGGVLDTWMDTAAAMRNLDLFIGSDSAPLHLAASLGVPTWLATSQVPDWRWMLQREDSPWYPTLRLFRQERLFDWASVFEAIHRELARVCVQVTENLQD